MIPGILCGSVDEVLAGGSGCFCVTRKESEGPYIAFRVLESFCRLPITPNPDPRSWTFSGTDACPTLEPSIFINPPNGWHGHLIAGNFIPV